MQDVYQHPHAHGKHHRGALTYLLISSRRLNINYRSRPAVAPNDSQQLTVMAHLPGTFPVLSHSNPRHNSTRDTMMIPFLHVGKRTPRHGRHLPVWQALPGVMKWWPATRGFPFLKLRLSYLSKARGLLSPLCLAKVPQ